MTGYAEYGLILCPHIDCFEFKTPEYKALLKKSVNKIIDFMLSKDIKPTMLCTDQVAAALNMERVIWESTITPDDCEWALTHCDYVKKAGDTDNHYPDFYEAVYELYPEEGEEDTSDTAYFDRLQKRVKLLERAVLKRHKVIFNIQTPSKASYNIKPKPDTGIILVNVHNGNFIPTAFMGDCEINPIELLDLPTGNRPVYEWEV